MRNINRAYAILDESGRFIGLDKDSGGYPYQADNLNQIEYFKDFDAAAKYVATMKYNERNHKWKIVEVDLTTRHLPEAYEERMDAIWVSRNERNDNEYQEYLRLHEKYAGGFA